MSALVKGLAGVVASGNQLPQGDIQVAAAAACMLCSHVSTAVARATSTRKKLQETDLLTYLMDAVLWGEMADCLTSSSEEVCDGHKLASHSVVELCLCVHRMWEEISVCACSAP